MQISIATGKTRTNSVIKNVSGGWDKLVSKLTTFTVTPEKYADYMQMNPDKQGSIKDVGYFIGGHFDGNIRKREMLKERTCITLDLDFLPSGDFEDIHWVYGDYEYVLHSTHKHSSSKPRHRLIFPTSRPMTPEEYQAVARYIAALLDIDFFDETAFRVTQLMYWPSRSSDGEEVGVYNKGNFVDPDLVLSTYQDWTDFGTWPVTAKEGKLTASDKKQEDPYDKPGIIGIFCRHYDIHQAIGQFDLPYECTEWANRYRPVGSSGASGAVVYGSDQCEAAFLYSNHESDAASSQLVNSWDLVRLNKFGVLDKGYDGSIGQAPSQKAMIAFALEIPDIESILAANEFADSGSITAPDYDDTGAEIAPVKLTFDTISNEIEDHKAEALLDRDTRKTLINRVAAAKLDAADTDVLAALIREASEAPKPSKKAVLEQIKVSSKRLTAELADESGSIADIEIELIQETLNTHFGEGKHLKRVGKKWWSYDAGLWSMDDDERIRGKMQKTFVKIRTERSEDIMPLVAVVGDAKTSALVSNLWIMFQSHMAEKESRADPLHLLDRIELPVINCLNGELHFNRKGDFELKEHDPENFFTIQIGTAYDPEAECPQWDNFMQMVFSESKDPENMIRHLEELGGYVIQHSRWLKSWILFKGNKDAGKSTVADVFQALLGTAAVSRELSAYGEKKSDFAEIGLQGKLLVVDDDYAKGAPLPDGFIKKTSEEKIITAGVKYGDDLRFVCRSLPMVLSNYWPISRDVTDAFRERAQIFDFNHRISAAEKDDSKKSIMLRDELPGILNRFVAGVSRLRARGDWNPPEDSRIAHANWVHHANPVGMFIDEMLIVEVTGKTKAQDCWRSYTNWFKSSNPSGRPTSKVEFYERMESIMGLRKYDDGESYFAGLSLRTFD